jgi:transcriptional regulator with XRE-family HTH domain
MEKGDVMRRRAKPVYLPRLPEIRIERARRGLSIPEMAQEMGLRRWTLAHVLTGDKLSRSVAERIAVYFGRPIDELFLMLDLEHLPAAPLTLPSSARGEDSGSERRNAA